MTLPLNDMFGKGSLNHVHADGLGRAFVKFLNKPDVGAMAFARFLEPETIAFLCASESRFVVPGWDVWGVMGQAHDNAGRFITADRAVDLREEKKNSVLLLVDSREAGAGMDGIYSSVREVSERELLHAASEITAKRLPKPARDFAEKAIARAGRMGRTGRISPWRTFDFWAQAFHAFETQPEGDETAAFAAVGACAALLGLWPIDFVAAGVGSPLTALETAAQLVERTLLPSGASLSVPARLDALLLSGDEAEQKKALERFLRETENEIWTERTLKLQKYPDLWVGVLRTGFDQQVLRGIELIPWRSTSAQNVPRWSGLTEAAEDGDTLLFRVHADVDKRAANKLEVRWKTMPADLPAGSVQYEVSLLTDGDVSLFTRTVAQTRGGAAHQKCVFTGEDLDEDLDINGKWQVKIRVTPLTDMINSDSRENDADADNAAAWRETDSFLLSFGDNEPSPRVGVGRKVRAFVEDTIKLDEDDFARTCRTLAAEDTRHFVSMVLGRDKRSARVYRPPLLAAIENDWKKRNFAAGRWKIRVRTDGSPADDPEFVPMETPKPIAGDLWKRWEEAGRALGVRACGERCGFVGMVYHENELADKYVNASIALWEAAAEMGTAAPAHAHTVEIQTLSGRSLGLIVLPSHPLRVAWHQGYDELAYWARFQEKMNPQDVVKTLSALDGSSTPVFLPGLAYGETFVFGDMLGFHAVAMTRDDEKEPQAVISQMARCLSPARDTDLAQPSVGAATANAIGREVERYLNLHSAYSSLRVAALRPGDGSTVARALGRALLQKSSEGEPSEEPLSGRLREAGFVLDLFPAPNAKDHQVVGRFLSETTERRRAGAGVVADDDRWILSSYQCGEVRLPRLKWTKSNKGEPTEPSHLSVAFDTYHASVVALSPQETAAVCGKEEGGAAHGPHPLEIFGLAPTLVRVFRRTPVPTWISTTAPLLDGDRHPKSRPLTDRLVKLQNALLHLTGRNAGGAAGSWPALKTTIDASRAADLQRLHENSDWVITVDRNAGIEYFDAPNEAPDVYETYVIDCVPERQDLSDVRLVTSTICVDEVTALLDTTLADMGLSRSPRNSRQLLGELKAVSGRLAMRLANQAQSRGELIALALMHAVCASGAHADTFPSLTEGFLMPLDDVRDLLLPDPSTPRTSQASRNALGTDGSPDETGDFPHGELRADLLYVSLPARKNAVPHFEVIEVKYRRLLKSAVDPALVDRIVDQTQATRQRITNLYFGNLPPTVRSVRRKRLVRALRFYADKARRHYLPGEAHARLAAAIDRLLRSGEVDWSTEGEDRGFIFCPEAVGLPRETDFLRRTRIVLFGPDAVALSAPPSLPIADSDKVEPISTAEARWENPDLADAPAISASIAISAPPSETTLLIGNVRATGADVSWQPSTKGNPHLMIVGQPGMGKTHCIVRLCEQLTQQGITPLVFAFHHDFEERLTQSLPRVRLLDVVNGLGFNPLRVTAPGPLAWIDNVGMLRDVFAAIFPDFGDLQNNEIREAIKQSYQELGYGAEAPDTAHVEPQIRQTPHFQRFYDLLRGRPKPNAGIVGRLDELNDYGFFRAEMAEEQNNLLAGNVPTVVRLYATQNEALQNATAAFVLLSLYQQMFQRGTQSQLTHAVIFDEAHRASRLKLIPTMAKECRKYGLSFVVASQEARDFSPSLFAAVSNYLILRVTDADASTLAKNVTNGNGQEASRLAARLKTLPKYEALFASEGKQPVFIQMAP